ncbi:MAG: hypothetical protein E7394_01360 [Ruminococcaceae bacterium]|nr:hypothetical protein [Oscillospiraceae bacterium]
MNNTECKLQMLDLYFSEYSFKNSHEDEDVNYNSSFTIKYAINSDDESKIKVTIDTNITNSTKTVELNLQTIGIFKIDKEGIEEEIYDTLMKKNTVAIIFPFIRSQISLLTTQPGMTPIVIPPVNINALIEEQN